MPGPATRSRWLELRRQRDAARRGRDLLDDRREALLREVLSRRGAVAEARSRAAERLAAARAALAEADVEMGLDAVEAAALAQAGGVAVDAHVERVAGVTVTVLRAPAHPFAARYGPGGTSASLDRAGRAYAAVLPLLVELASAERILVALSSALTKTNRRLRALENVLLPDLDREIARTASELEEEERDGAVRRSRFRPREIEAARAPGSPWR